MPIYSYRCTKCGKHFDLSQSFADDPVKDCPYCGAKGSVKKTYSDSDVAVIYHGSGYYCTPIILIQDAAATHVPTRTEE